MAGCDVVAIRPGAGSAAPVLAILELKLGLTLDLLLQGAERAAAADQVWLAVPATRRGRDRDRRAWALCRLLGFGLLAVHAGNGEAEVLVEAGPGWSRSNPRRRRAVLAEHAARQGDPSPGGTAGEPVMTAYRQDALACAAALASGPKRPRDLAAATPRARAIMARNVYGWFQRTSRGIYALTAEGEAALLRWGGGRDGMPGR